MRYVMINPEVMVPQLVLGLIEMDQLFEGPQYIDVTDRPEITATSWYDLSIGEFVDAPPYVEPPPTLASQSFKLQQYTQLANAQKNALTNRISTINDAIEFEEATQAEIDELPVRQAQLILWKKYAIALGRVTAQEGWYPVVAWPVQPPEGMDLTVSARASETY